MSDECGHWTLRRLLALGDKEEEVEGGKELKGEEEGEVM